MPRRGEKQERAEIISQLEEMTSKCHKKFK